MAGDARASVPPACDARDIYLLSAGLHGFDDATCRDILANLARAIGTRIAVLEMVLPDSHAAAAAASFDMQMVMGTRGRERTRQERQALVSGAGLRLEEHAGLRSLASILLLGA